MDIDLVTILLTMVNFLIVVAVLWFLLFKPVLKVLDERRARIEAELIEADTQKKEALGLLNEAQTKAQTLQLEAERQMDEAIHLAELKQDDMLKDARKQTQAMIAKAEDDIRNLRKRSLRKEQHAISDLSVELAGKLMRASVNEEAQSDLIDRFMEELEVDDHVASGQ